MMLRVFPVVPADGRGVLTVGLHAEFAAEPVRVVLLWGMLLYCLFVLPTGCALRKGKNVNSIVLKVQQRHIMRKWGTKNLNSCIGLLEFYASKSNQIKTGQLHVYKLLCLVTGTVAKLLLFLLLWQFKSVCNGQIEINALRLISKKNINSNCRAAHQTQNSWLLKNPTLFFGLVIGIEWIISLHPVWGRALW